MCIMAYKIVLLKFYIFKQSTTYLFIYKDSLYLSKTSNLIFHLKV